MRKWLIRKLIGRRLKAWVIWKAILMERQAINPKDRRPHLTQVGGLWMCRLQRGVDIGGYGDTKEEAYADWKYHSPVAPLDSDIRCEEWGARRMIVKYVIDSASNKDYEAIF